MSDIVRCLRDAGIQVFREYLQALRAGSTDRPPHEILTRADTSAPPDQDIRVEPVTPADHFAMSEYLHAQLAPLAHTTHIKSVGLWGWLSLYYFDLVCPVRANGTRVPGRDYRHIPEKGFWFAHRHLLAGPYFAYETYGAKTRFMLTTPLYRENTLFHELAARQSLMSNAAVIEAASLLYFDRTRGKPKRKVTTGSEEPGNLNRFVNVIQQLDVTYDLYSLTAREILDLLPGEFDKWRPPLRLFAEG
ncbi:MAG: hypothetical protein WC713_09610 [Candidatus Methylomirabilota bacterium]